MEEISNLLKKVTSFQKEAYKIFGTNSKANNRNRDYFDVGIITSTLDEFEAITSILSDICDIEIEGNNTILYKSGYLEKKNGKAKVIIPIPLEMGIEAAVISAIKLTDSFNLTYIFMAGVAAGNKKTSKIGDILIAEKSLNYNQVVEVENSNSEIKKKFMQNVSSIDNSLKTKFKLFSRSKCLEEIYQNSPINNEAIGKLKCNIGLMVTGSSLLRSDQKILEINNDYHGVIGLDMETYGFYYAISSIDKSKMPYFASIKSVSDFGDNSKHTLSSDERKKYALYTSSMTLKQFIKNYIE